ncbi:ERCC4 domain-containing protein [Daldinia decipiens]|uniref:ERCC4 domain-containing protein n=1 Tax=Daldinia decipiens TaxID=326647 RepID=UPI0020C1D2B1|nr:ERCC4 domain-containing protein [Daldinia decipiens]KAI1653670.1 ERCC4 domain-containing protein [Daldinia decipiens]
MPTEVISLLSSSPVAPSRPILATSPEVSPRVGQAGPSRALDYGSYNLTAVPPPKRPNGQSDKRSYGLVTGAKRTNSGHIRQDNDFLFLSDESDTTGDLDGNVAKKARASTSTTRLKKREDTGLKKTKSATGSSKVRKPLSPVVLKRWNSVIDPIEHSSSPGSFTARKVQNKPDVLSDPFESPPKKQTATNAKSFLLDLSSDPFRSSPRQDVNEFQPSRAQKLPADDTSDSLTSKKASKVPIFIDLSDGEPESPEGIRLPKKSKQNGAWDPISSSMPESRAPKRDSLMDSDSDLPELSEINFSRLSRRKYSLSPSPPRKKSEPTAKTLTAKKTAGPKKTNEEKEQEKREKAEAREAEKERIRVEKENAKQQRAIEKEKEKALAEVNKLKTDRKAAVPEMIVDLPSALSVGIKTQIEKLLGSMDVQFEYWHSHASNVVKWRRKVGSKYNEELGHWEPIPMRIKAEEHVMVIIEAAGFVKLVLGPEGQDLEAHVLKMKTSFPDGTLIYLIEGLTPWMRKNKNILNRRFTSAVRALDTNNVAESTSSSSQPSRRRDTTQQEYIDEDIIEDALLSLQVVHGALIHHTNVPVETAEWVAVFTQHISTIPYRKARDAATDAGFCMEVGQVRTGEGAKETYLRMLQEVTRVTAPIAYGIAAKYGTVSELVRGLEEDGPLALENCRRCANKDGAFSDRAVGPAISKRIYKIFTSQDPGSMDV